MNNPEKIMTLKAYFSDAFPKGVGKTPEAIIDAFFAVGMVPADREDLMAFMDNLSGIAIDYGKDPADIFLDFAKEYPKRRAADEQRQKEIATKAYFAKMATISDDLEAGRVSTEDAMIAQEKLTAGLARSKKATVKPVSFEDWMSADAGGDKDFRPAILKNVAIKSGALTYVGARPGIGKTTFLINLAADALNAGRQVFFLTYEEKGTRILDKLLVNLFASPRQSAGKAWKGWWADGGGNPLETLRAVRRRTKNAPDHAKDEAARIKGWLDSGKLKVIDRPGDVVALIAQIDPEPTAVVLIDYVQKIPGGRADTRQLQIQEISGKLLDAAVRMDVPFVIAAQLRRVNTPQKGDQDNDEQAPSLEQFRESGDIEQDANLALALYRPKRSEKGMKIFVLKNREGETMEPDTIMVAKKSKVSGGIPAKMYGSLWTILPDEEAKR
jgi:hypothetical protein